MVQVIECIWRGSFKLSSLHSDAPLKANVITVLKASISLGWSCHIRGWAIRLAACVIHLTMLRPFTTFGCQPQEEAEALRKKQTYTLPLEELYQNIQLWLFAVLPMFTKFRARGTQKWMKLGEKFSVKKPLHVQMDVKKHRNKVEITTLNKTNLIEFFHWCHKWWHHSFGGQFGVHTYAVESNRSCHVSTMCDLVSDEEEFDRTLGNIINDVLVDDPGETGTSTVWLPTWLTGKSWRFWHIAARVGLMPGANCRTTMMSLVHMFNAVLRKTC